MPYTVACGGGCGGGVGGVSQLQVLIAALSCIACRCNSLALIGCERAAISCTRMQLQPAVASCAAASPIIIVIPASDRDGR